MNKKISIIASLLLSASLLAACGGKEDDKEKIIIGATPVPHAEILENIKDDLDELGYTLEIKIFNDYIIPNTALSDGQLDANFFQHIPYLESMNASDNLGITWATKVHLEPLGLYSDKIKSLDELSEGATITIPNDNTNGSRALKLLADNGLITLEDKELVSLLDIKSNKLNLKIEELDAPALARTLQDVEASVINTNYALEADLNPTEDAIIIESSDSPYANVLAVREDDRASEKTKALVKVLNSEKTKKFIEEEYKGSILPAFEENK